MWRCGGRCASTGEVCGGVGEGVHPQVRCLEVWGGCASTGEVCGGVGEDVHSRVRCVEVCGRVCIHG